MIPVTNNELQEGMAWLIGQGYVDNDQSADAVNHQNSSCAHTEAVPISEIDRSDATQSNIMKAKHSLRYTGGHSYAVLWQESGQNKQSPWFRSKKNADRALAIIRSRGFKAVIYVD